MHVCSGLRKRYLWVDRLCILQDDFELKHKRIASMGFIYASAHFTIVALAREKGDYGLPGVSNTPHKPPTWSSRAETG